MFIKESLRLYPPVYFISRKLDEPLTLRSLLNKAYELVVPKGSSVGLHIFALHRNSLVWENVEVMSLFRHSFEISVPNKWFEA